ncbi:site-specific integrase [Actinoplanes lobatus]|uniref:Integrase n=1 Tax=Actinoplanes lobatus TaxID=113568 RepID=A0A7W7HCE2_9ACTN|nr:site-specific integrase [Actinoplanes lobatus]MBB4747577.1 integrase [Actinoplanes lobatus]GGN74069.1 site-specific integrase [Actinoplanes lobatus]GIE39862.1 site-specific integrase [Actinoplanes lobatus]
MAKRGSDDGEAKRRPNGESSIYQGADGKWHGRVTMGVKDDGTPDRRHVERKTETEVIRAVRALERQRDSGKVRKAGSFWTVAKWLMFWIENIACPPNVKPNTADGYRVAVKVHLIPGIGAHRLEKLTPEHIEKLMRKMQDGGSAAGTAHQAFRTLRTALNEAERRGHLTKNPVLLAKSPRLSEKEVEPYSVEEVQRILAQAAQRPRNGTRWAIALALGLRQGEVLGLRWENIDLEKKSLRVRKNRLRPKYAHGCTDPCGKKSGYCPRRKQINKDTDDTKSRAGRRVMGIPDEVVTLLRAHKDTQDKERRTAAQLWEDGGWVFTTPIGRALNPNTDYHEWKKLLKDACVRDARLHDARHTAATVLMLLGIQERAVMDVMGWATTGMAARYQHVSDPVRANIADRVGGLIWQPVKAAEAPAAEPVAGVSRSQLRRKLRRRG